MTITFENDNDVIVYALEMIISYARKNQYIFVAQSVWWIASIIGLTEGLVIYIDNSHIRSESHQIPLQEIDQLSLASEVSSEATDKVSTINSDRLIQDVSTTARDI